MNQTKTLNMPANRPRAFRIDCLSPGERYLVCFGGVHRDDAQARLGQLRTLNLHEPVVRVIGVSADRPDRVLKGEHNMWETLCERLLREELPPVDVMVHLGGQVSTARSFEHAWVLLRRNSERKDLRPGEWEAVEEEALEHLRDAYRFNWNLPYTRETLACVSHLMLWSDLDIYENFTLNIELSRAAGGHAVATLLRLARRVYREYQRQLWDPDVDVLEAQEAEFSAQLRVAFEASMHRSATESALESAAAKLERLKNSEGGDRVEMMRHCAKVIEDHKSELATLTATVDAANEATANPPPMHDMSFHMLGVNTGLIMLDLRGARLGADGSQNSDAPLMDDSQWDAINHHLERNPDLRCLLVCCEQPVVADTREGTRARLEQDPHRYEHLRSTWAFNSKDQTKLLRLLFDWKRAEPAYRDALLLCGGIRIGVDSLISDKFPEGQENYNRQATSIRQITTGPVTDDVSDFWGEREGAIDHRVSFKHLPMYHQRNYAECVLRTGARLERSVVQAGLVGQFHENVSATVGPVIGRVTSSSAVVLVEVDAEAPVTCVLTDVLTRQQYRQMRLLPKNVPFAFKMERLQFERCYTVHLEGITNTLSRRGAITTPPEGADVGVNLLVLAEEVPDESSASFVEDPEAGREDDSSPVSPGRADSNAAESKKKADSVGASVWDAVNSFAMRPWGGCDVVVHLGNQVAADRACSEAITLLGRREAELGADISPAERERLEDEVLDRLRNAYRTLWNLPGTREALAHCSHLMIWGQRDMGSSESPVMRRLLHRVYREYQRQLWDPISNIPGGGGGGGGGGGDGSAADASAAATATIPADLAEVQEWHFHEWGAVGLFVMDLKGNRFNDDSGGGAAGDGSVSADGGAVPVPAQAATPPTRPLISEAQWSALAEVLMNTTTKVLLVASEFPFVDDSIADARYKAGFGHHAHLMSRWPYNEGDLMRLLRALFDWRAGVINDPNAGPGAGVAGAQQARSEGGGGASAQREVLLLCGGLCVGVETLIQDSATDASIRQITAGPATDNAKALFAERQGMVDEGAQATMSYEHKVEINKPNFAIVTVGFEDGPVASLAQRAPSTQAALFIPGDSRPALARSLLRRPEWLNTLHRSNPVSLVPQPEVNLAEEHAKDAMGGGEGQKAEALQKAMIEELGRVNKREMEEREARERQRLELLKVAQSREREEHVAMERLEKLMAAPAIDTGIRDIFNHLFVCGRVEDPAVFAQRMLPPLVHFHQSVAGAAFRDLVPEPCAFVLENVARRRNQQSDPQDVFEIGGAGIGGGGDGASAAVKKEEEKPAADPAGGEELSGLRPPSAGGDGPNSSSETDIAARGAIRGRRKDRAPITLMSESSFVALCHEIFEQSILLSRRVQR